MGTLPIVSTFYSDYQASNKMKPIKIKQDDKNSDIEIDVFLGKISIQDTHDKESITIALHKWQEVKSVIDNIVASIEVVK